MSERNCPTCANYIKPRWDCPTCGGKGTVPAPPAEQVCPECKGAGFTLGGDDSKDTGWSSCPCPMCKGKCKIPAPAETGKTLDLQYIAYLRYRHRADTSETYLALCDSDSEGAFPVWGKRAIQEYASRATAPLLAKLAEKNYVIDARETKIKILDDEITKSHLKREAYLHKIAFLTDQLKAKDEVTEKLAELEAEHAKDLVDCNHDWSETYKAMEAELTAKLAQVEADLNTWMGKAFNNGDEVGWLNAKLKEKDEELFQMQQDAINTEIQHQNEILELKALAGSGGKVDA